MRSPNDDTAQRRARRGRGVVEAGTVAVGLALAACASIDAPPPASQQTARSAPRLIPQPAPLQCVPYARDVSGLELRGDAATWWDQAQGRYRRSGRPAAGAVLVMRGFQTNARGHVAVVREVVAAREILVDQANWFNQGEISLNVPVQDVSPQGDWSQVRVWHIPTRQWGARVYSVQGFLSR